MVDLVRKKSDSTTSDKIFLQYMQMLSSLAGKKSETTSNYQLYYK